jgi:transcriptional regulator with XRE-family HTH domain
MLEIGQRMKELREAAHLSQAEAARLCGSNQSTIARMEKGQTAPTIKVLVWWADFFDVSMDYLCCRTDAPQGKIYGCRPRRKINKEEMNLFIEMCFDPKSPVSSRVKEALAEILEEGRK